MIQENESRENKVDNVFEVKNSLIQCVTFTKMNINDKIIEALGQIPEQHN